MLILFRVIQDILHDSVWSFLTIVITLYAFGAINNLSNDGLFKAIAISILYSGYKMLLSLDVTDGSVGGDDMHG